jgi:hypothetical protein
MMFRRVKPETTTGISIVNHVKSLIKKLLMVFGWGTIKLMRLSAPIRKRINPRTLVTAHLFRSGNPRHPNAKAFIEVLGNFDGRPLQILETGTSAWGADSTRLWDEYVRYAGGHVKSVDIRSEPSEQLKGRLSRNTHLEVGDSVAFLQRLADKSELADLIYLDSFDVNWQDPEPAEIHGEAEFKIAMGMIRVGGIILIDDTPTPEVAAQNGICPPNTREEGSFRFRGKGARAFRLVEQNSNFTIFFHDYAVAFKRIK